MFITVDGFKKTGIPSALWDLMEPYSRIDHATGIAVLAVVILVLSNLASNVPTGKHIHLPKQFFFLSLEHKKRPKLDSYSSLLRAFSSDEPKHSIYVLQFCCLEQELQPQLLQFPKQMRRRHG